MAQGSALFPLMPSAGSRAPLVLLILKALIYMIPFVGGFLAGVLTPILLPVVVGVGLAKDVFEMVRPSAARHFNFSTASER